MLLRAPFFAVKFIEKTIFLSWKLRIEWVEGFALCLVNVRWANERKAIKRRTRFNVFMSLHFTQFYNDYSRWMQIEAQWQCELNQNTKRKKNVTFCWVKRSWILTTSWMRNSNWVLRPSTIRFWFFFIYRVQKYDCYKFQRLIMELEWYTAQRIQSTTNIVEGNYV